MTLQSYSESRRFWEVLLWTLFLIVIFLSDIGVIWFDLRRVGSNLPLWEPVVWESTSLLATAVLIPLILWFDSRFPIRLDTWRRSVPAHALFTLVFSLLHVSLMYRARIGIYGLVGGNSGYYWDNWWAEFGYEYLKDFRSYLLIIALIYLYRFTLRRLQGEAGFLSEDPEQKDATAVTDRFLIKKLGREFLIRVNDIDWIEASGNYVNLHVGSRVYPLRETMTNIAERLASHGFQRVHRSAAVNLDRVAEIVAYDAGDGEARLHNEARVPVSRRFRKDLRERLS